MSNDKKDNSKRDLTNSSNTLRNENASDKQRGIAGQNLANHRWLMEKERELSRVTSKRGVTSRDRTRGR